MRILVFGAHPDDAEYHAGGLLWRHARRGANIRLISVTDGSAGHHTMHRFELAVRRRQEARAAGALLGAEYSTWDFPDAALEATLELRHRIIREIRQFQPQLILTHRPYDYHPDHRAVGLAVQDACYLVTVPSVVPDVSHMPCDPVVAYMCDLFTRPVPLRPDVVLDVTNHLDSIIQMLACHESQFFEFLPYNHGVTGVPQGQQERPAWLREWFLRLVAPRVERFLPARSGQSGSNPDQAIIVEAYEICEYGRRPSQEELAQLFPE